MPGDKDVCVEGLSLYFIPLRFRSPLKFGRETLESCDCVRARISVATHSGATVAGWGETPLGATWAWATHTISGHALEIGHLFTRDVLPADYFEELALFIDYMRRRGHAAGGDKP